MTLPKERKLTIIFRVEPGCLGPNGDKMIIDFCADAQIQIESDCINWQIEPRNNKNDSEIQFYIGSKLLPREKAEKYLSVLGISIEHVEAQLLENITELIEQYLN